MRRSLRSRAPNNKVETASFELKGGLNLVDPPLEIPAGMLLAATNYELLPRGGYRRIDGFERSDGQPRPSDANYWILDFDAGGLGPELVTNGDFTGDASGWALGTGWAYGTNNLVATSATGNTTQSDVAVVDNATYQLSYTLSGYVDGSYALRLYNGSFAGDSTVRTANGTYTEDLTLNVASGAAASVRAVTVVDGTATIDDISVKKVTKYRIYANTLPDGTAHPAVIYQVISDVPFDSILGEDPGKNLARIQLTIIADSTASRIAVNDAIKTALKRYKGASGDVTILDARLDNVVDLPYDLETGETARVADYMIYYE